MDDDIELIPYDNAMKRLPSGEHIHTFRQAGPMLLGCDHDRASLLQAMKAVTEIQAAGPQAQAINHGLAIKDEHGWLFIATVKPADSEVVA